MTNSAISIVPSSAGENTAITRDLELKAAARRFQLLVVDDDAAIRELASDLFKDAGYKVMTAGDGHEALRRIGGTLPDLVITDLHMPRMSGFELLKVLRVRFPQIPVIAVSAEFNGDGLPPDVIADAFLSKDCYTTARFATKIRELLAISPMRQAEAEEVYHPHIEVAYQDGDLMAVLGRLARRAGRLVTEGREQGTASEQDCTLRPPSAFATSLD